MTIAEAAERVTDSVFESWPVADELGLVGMVRIRHIAAAMDQGKQEMTIARLMQIARRSASVSGAPAGAAIARLRPAADRALDRAGWQRANDGDHHPQRAHHGRFGG